MWLEQTGERFSDLSSIQKEKFIRELRDERSEVLSRVPVKTLRAKSVQFDLTEEEKGLLKTLGISQKALKEMMKENKDGA